jgi:hypothetical protein
MIVIWIMIMIILYLDLDLDRDLDRMHHSQQRGLSVEVVEWLPIQLFNENGI